MIRDKLISLVLFIITINHVKCKLPNDFEKFIGILFETPECEDFLAGGELLGVSTTECKPFTCDFPRQMCMRESSKYQDPSANQCVTIPTQCITAANGGVPVGNGPPTVKKIRPPPPPPPERFGGPRNINGNRPPPMILVTAGPDLVISTKKSRPSKYGDICKQKVPEGRFCGFALKFTYNTETGNCEQFWFPGCRTDETNDNLFDDENQCRQVTQHCSEVPTTTQKPIRIRVPTPQPTTTPKPKPKPKNKPRPTTPEPEYPDPDIGLPPSSVSSNRGPSFGGVDLGSLTKTFMGGGSSGGLVSQFLGSGLGGGSRGPSPTSSVVPSGYGGANLGGAGAGVEGGAGGNSGGGGNFISLIANTVQQLGQHKGHHGGGAGGGQAAKVAQQWLNPNQLGSLFSMEDDLTKFKKIDKKDICNLPRDVGHRNCQSFQWSKRFYYDYNTGECRGMWYLGCGGNINNFKKLSHCHSICNNLKT